MRPLLKNFNAFPLVFVRKVAKLVLWSMSIIVCIIHIIISFNNLQSDLICGNCSVLTFFDKFIMYSASHYAFVSRQLLLVIVK